MNKDPAFLFYSSDFLVGTMLMSNDQVGKYIRLICIAHSKGGYLTKDDMFKICNTDDKDVLNKFNVDDDGVYYNERLLSEITKRKKYSDSRRNNRKGKEENKEDMNNTCETYEPHMENENINSISSNSLSLKKKNNKVKKTFQKPNVDEVIEYAKLRDQTEELAKQFFDYFEVGNWIDSQGKPVLNWKQKFNTWTSFKKQPGRSSKVEKMTEYAQIETNLSDNDITGIEDAFAKL